MTYKVGTDSGAKSDTGLQLIFLEGTRLRGVFELKNSSCDWTEAENTDLVKICAAWMSTVTSVIVKAKSDDGVEIEFMNINIGAKSAYKEKFWLDNPNTDTYPGGYSAHVQVSFFM